ncbi:MAG: hypothetical protein GXO15_06400 [Crenarchaeota archaeon]|nr:hypothetical protein [Thermoproteota archaeon]
MALKLLVAGLLEHDSGKTWLAAALASAASRRGLRGAAYKPVGGFNMWHSYWAFRESLEERVLAGGDAWTYVRLLGLSPDRVNPIALLLAPRDPTRYPGPAMYASEMESLEKSLALARVSRCGDGERLHLFFPQALEKAPTLVADELRRAARLLGAAEGEPRRFLDWLSSRDASKLLDECLSSLEAGSDLVVVESFNDAAVPYIGSISYDFVVVAAPGKALLYSGDRLAAVMNLLEPSTPPRVGRILNLLGKPLHVEDLPPASELEEYIRKVEDTRLASLVSG